MVFVDANTKTEADKDVVELSKKDAVFIRVMKVNLTGIDEPKDSKAKKAEKPVVPVARLEQPDLWQSFGVKSAGTVVVADWYGNETNRYPSMPGAAVLTSAIKSAVDSVDKNDKKLEKIAEAASQAADSGDTKGAVRNVLKYFKEEKTGFASFSRMVTLYNTLVADGRAKIQAAREANDEAAIKDLTSTFKGTDLESELKP